MKNFLTLCPTGSNGFDNKPKFSKMFSAMVNFEEFSKIDLRVAKVLSVETIENSVKLYKLEVDLGSEKRQIISGIAGSYSPEELIGKTIVLVANLEPKVIMGFESHGMLLAADRNDQPVLLTVDGEANPGDKIG